MASITIDKPVTDKRLEHFLKDKEQVVACCKDCKFVSAVSNNDDNNLLLEFVNGEKKIVYIVHYTPDYPSNTFVSQADDPAGIKFYTKPLSDIFADLCNEWCTLHGLPKDDLPNIINKKCSPPQSFTSQISNATTSSGLSEESDEQDYFDEDFEDDYDNEEDIISSLLNKDIENFQELYGKTSIEIRVHAGINEVDIILYIDMGFLDVHTSSAWGVNRDMPVTLHVHLQSASKYLDGPEPKIEVYQGSPDSKDKIIFGLGNQMRKIVEGFLSTQWKTTSNYFLEQAYETVAIREPVPSQLTPTNTPPSTLPDATSDSLMALLGMGFDLELAKQALEMCEQKVEKAVHLLTSGELLDDEDEEENKTEKDNASGATVPVEFERQDSQGARAMLSADNNLDQVKQIPSLEHGFLVQIMKYLLNRIPSLNEFCVICDERHVLETGLIKPCVCTRELCVFAFQTLGVMADTAESVATDADVVDLMIAMCNAAASSNRASVILDPYPSIVDPFNSHRLAMDPSKKNFEEVKTVLAAIINGREELLRGRCTHQSLKCALDQHHNLAFPLMQWIVATNRAYIVMIPEDRQLKSMRTKYQFLLISSPPAKELAFQQAKNAHGSAYAFHGSNIENWHSIMRKGLINASGTKYQLHGAAYGSGIYLSPNAGTSFGYSNRQYYTSTKNSSTGKETLAGKVGLICIALCEVVTSNCLKKSGDIWVCTNAEHVVTRFFFVYDAPSYQGATSIHTNNKDFKNEITAAIQLTHKLRKL